MFRKYSKGILLPLSIIVLFIFCGLVDGGAEAGNYPIRENATVQIVVTLENGNKYVVSEKETEVSINTYNSTNPEDWDITRY